MNSRHDHVWMKIMNWQAPDGQRLIGWWPKGFCECSFDVRMNFAPDSRDAIVFLTSVWKELRFCLRFKAWKWTHRPVMPRMVQKHLFEFRSVFFSRQNIECQVDRRITGQDRQDIPHDEAAALTQKTFSVDRKIWFWNKFEQWPIDQTITNLPLFDVAFDAHRSVVLPFWNR